MKKELLKSIAIYSEEYEDITLGGRNIPLVLSGVNGVYLCVGDDADSQADIKLYHMVQQELGLSKGQLFLLRISEDNSGDFYDGTNFVPADKVQEDIYEIFKTCYNFTAAYMVERTIVSMLQKNAVCSC